MFVSLEYWNSQMFPTTHKNKFSRFLCFWFLLFVLVYLKKTYQSEVENTPIAVARVLHGEVAPKGRFPYMCSLKRRGFREHGCGATLIHEKWILTAAHCVDPKFEGSLGAVPLVYCDMFERTAVDAQKWTGKVEDGSDIALIQLEKAASFVTPQMGVPETEYTAAQLLSVIGWGTRGQKDPPQKLQIASDLRYVNWKTCNREQWWNGTIKESMCCASSNIAKQDACQGDSGGPLLLVDEYGGGIKSGTPSFDILVGITSFGTKSCSGSIPGVYTSVSYFLPWIRCVIKSKEACSSKFLEKFEASPSTKSAKSSPSKEPRLASSTQPHGRQPAPEDRFPYMCSLRRRTTNQHMCGATLINSRWVITAAACVDPNITFSAGLSPLVVCNIYEREDSDQQKEYGVEKTIILSLWDSNVENGNDIALLKLTNKANVKKFPILDPPENKHFPETLVAALGWGAHNSSTHKLSSELLIAAGLRYVNWEMCNRKTWWDGRIKKSMCCTYSSFGDTCIGDNGGPLIQAHAPNDFIQDGSPSKDILVGLISFGAGDCGSSFPSVYTRVSYYRSWMDCIMKGKNEKKCLEKHLRDHPDDNLVDAERFVENRSLPTDGVHLDDFEKRREFKVHPRPLQQ